jgi:hypothetical protein
MGERKLRDELHAAQQRIAKLEKIIEQAKEVCGLLGGSTLQMKLRSILDGKW